MSDRDDVLMRLLSGDLDPNGDEGQDALDRHPELRAEFEELTRIERAMESTARDREADVRALSTRTDAAIAEDETRAARHLEALWGPPAPAISRRPLVVPLLLAAAALVLAVWAFWPAEDPDAPPVTPDPNEMLGQPMEFLLPAADAASFERFAWEPPFEVGAGTYRITVTPMDAGAQPFVLEVDTAEWCPTTDEDARMGRVVQVRVEALRAGERRTFASVQEVFRR